VDPGNSLYTGEKNCILGIEPLFLSHPAYSIVTIPTEFILNAVMLYIIIYTAKIYS
jgi:hypothetical protein